MRERRSAYETILAEARVTPTQIGPYRIDGVLGRGGMGVVYAASRPGGGPPLALKLLHARSLSGEERLRREALYCAQLQHPHVVPVVDAGDVDGRPYVVFRRIEGARHLGQLLDALPSAELLDLLEQAARGLGCAHAAGIVHRDVKPENVLVDGRGRAYVSDFGVARDDAAQRLTQTGGLVGSMLYMSPEALRADGAVTPAADVWALGVILYRVLGGRLPFPAEHLFDYYKRVEAGPPPLAGVDPALRALAERALAADPAERPRDGERFADALAAARAPSPASVATPRLRRGAWVSVPLAALALGAAAAVALRGEDAPPVTPAPAPAPRAEAPREPAPAPEEARDGSRLVWVAPGSVSWQRGLGRARLRTTLGTWIGRAPVTAGAFRRFLTLHGLSRGSAGPVRGPDDAPLQAVSWLEAAAYCRWAGLALPTRAELVRAALDPDLPLQRAPGLEEYVQDWWRPTLALEGEEEVDPRGPHLWRLALRAHPAPRDVPHRLRLVPATLAASGEDYELPGSPGVRAGFRVARPPADPARDVDWSAARWTVRWTARVVSREAFPDLEAAYALEGTAEEVPLLLGDWLPSAPASGVLCASLELELPAGTWGISASGRGPVDLDLPDHPFVAPEGPGSISEDPGRRWWFRTGERGAEAWVDLQGAHRVLHLDRPQRVRVRLAHTWAGAFEFAALIYAERAEPAPR